MFEEELLKPLSRSLVKPIILGLLERGERHGYSLMSEIKRLTGRSIGPSLLYPALKELELRGYVKGKWLSKGRRKIKEYSITERGRAILKRFKEYLSALLQELSS